MGIMVAGERGEVLGEYHYMILAALGLLRIEEIYTPLIRRILQ